MNMAALTCSESLVFNGSLERSYPNEVGEAIIHIDYHECFSNIFRIMVHQSRGGFC